MLQNLIAILKEESYSLQDPEAALFFPIVCEKSGQNNAQFKNMIRSLIHTSTSIYPPEKIFMFVFAGCNSKNVKTKIECLEELGDLIRDFGINIAQTKDIKYIAKCVNSFDNNMRTAAVKTMGEIYKFAGDKIWIMIGEVSDKVKDLLEHRFNSISGENFLEPTNRGTPKESLLKITSPTTNGVVRNLFERKGSLKKVEIKESINLDELIPPQQFIESKPLISEISTHDIAITNAVELLEDDKLISVYNTDVDESLLYESSKFNETVSELERNIEILISGDMSSRVDALVAINDFILNNLESQREEFQQKSNMLSEALTKVIIDTFDRPTQDISLRFAKYFLNVVHKVCSTKIIMSELCESSLNSFTEQILIRLLTEELEKAGEKGEGEVMLKALNGTMLRILENSQPTMMMVVLIKLLTKYKLNSKLPKLPGLIIRCMLKVTKSLIHVIQQNETDKILLAMHEYLIQVRVTTGEDNGSKALKSILNELVKLQGKSI